MHRRATVMADVSVHLGCKRGSDRAALALLLYLSSAGSVGCRTRDDHAPPRTVPATAEPQGKADPSRVGVGDEWPMATGDHQNTRFSQLAQIDTTNVSQLRLAWTFSTGHTKGHEAAPLVVDGTLYVVTPFPNVVFALDLSQP